jgi:hypothetical protein
MTQYAQESRAVRSQMYCVSGSGTKVLIANNFLDDACLTVASRLLCIDFSALHGLTWSLKCWTILKWHAKFAGILKRPSKFMPFLRWFYRYQPVHVTAGNPKVLRCFFLRNRCFLFSIYFVETVLLNSGVPLTATKTLGMLSRFSCSQTRCRHHENWFRIRYADALVQQKFAMYMVVCFGNGHRLIRQSIQRYLCLNRFARQITSNL